MNNQAPPDTPDSSAEDNIEAALRARLALLRTEHQQINAAILEQTLHPSADELMIRRMKKRKLLLKDSILSIEKMLDPEPDEYA